MLPALAVIQVLLSIALCALILMHSGRDAGLGGMGYTPASQGGTHIVERNLTRVTVVVAVLFAANCVALAVAASGCGSHVHARARMQARLAAAPRTIRVALSDLRWPLDPALATTRDETTLARAVFSTPLRTGANEDVVAGLCSAWSASNGFRTWSFRCKDAVEIGAELRRVGHMRASPAYWIFSAARSVTVPAPGRLVVALDFPWRRFPYALTTVAAAPRGIPGPFRIVRGSSTRVVARANGRTLVFERLKPFAAERAFLHGEVDDAPVPLGDIGRFRGSQNLRVRPVLALDAVVFTKPVPIEVRRAFWQTADRGDYQALVAENGATAALGVVGANERADPAAFRRAVHSIPSLPALPVRIAVPADPALQYGARILYAQWRELGLGPVLVPPNARSDAYVTRARAPYPQEEALLAVLGLPSDLGSADQRRVFARIDGFLQVKAPVIPICWVDDARLVSPRLTGWHENVLGDVDYTAIR
jgi:preprotein translocase subunit SecG